MWFETLTGFTEDSATTVHENLTVDGEVMTSGRNGRQFTCGRLETPTLAELRTRYAARELPAGKLQLEEVVGDVQQLHLDPANAGAAFQVASQFNLLEMVSPSVTPERGVGIYENDHTQGPACAIACGAGTIYRNYFVPVNGKRGQTADNQIDCLADLGRELGNSDGRLWEMRNGYALATENGLKEISQRLSAANEEERDRLRGALRIGVQWNTQVTLGDAEYTVTQIYCSATPVAYSSHSDDLWAPFARLVLEASYEAAFSVAALNARQTNNNRLFLTMLGGGAFGNREEWIFDAVRRAATIFVNADLNVGIVSYGRSKPQLCEFISAVL